MNFEKNTCMYLYLRKRDYTIQEIKRAWLGALDGMQPGRGEGGRGSCDFQLYKRLVSTQKQHVCGPKVIIK